MGERTLRRLLIIGSSAGRATSQQTRRTKRFVARTDAGSQTALLVTVALANKTARIPWALLVKQENYRAPVAARA
jgi:hypothetical protein